MAQNPEPCEFVSWLLVAPSVEWEWEGLGKDLSSKCVMNA